MNTYSYAYLCLCLYLFFYGQQEYAHSIYIELYFLPVSQLSEREKANVS